MQQPPNIDRPFFAYGLFRPGQLAFFQLRELVSMVTDPTHARGSLRLRDGLPIIDPSGHELVKGALLTFRPECTAEAYNRISAMEPDKHTVGTKIKSTANPQTCWSVGLREKAAYHARTKSGTGGVIRFSQQLWT